MVGMQVDAFQSDSRFEVPLKPFALLAPSGTGLDGRM